VLQSPIESEIDKSSNSKALKWFLEQSDTYKVAVLHGYAIDATPEWMVSWIAEVQQGERQFSPNQIQSIVDAYDTWCYWYTVIVVVGSVIAALVVLTLKYKYVEKRHNQAT
jgi:hypothetical protein